MASKQQTHCRNGHEITPENTRWTRRKGRDRPTRICKVCTRFQYQIIKAKRLRLEPPESKRGEPIVYDEEVATLLREMDFTLPPRIIRRVDLSRKDINRMVYLRRNGWSYGRIGRELEISPKVVEGRLRKRGL